MSVGRTAAEGSIVRRVYNRTLRPLLPRKLCSFHGVPVKRVRLLDRTEYCGHKSAAQDLIRSTVTPGDRVVDVGTGLGVFAVTAAQAGGEVITYEAAANMAEFARETIQLSGVSDRIDLREALVGPEVKLFGEHAAGGRVPPAGLPACDILILDCEGAELDIIGHVQPHPETVLVETHPDFGAPTDAVEAALVDRGYRTVESRAIDHWDFIHAEVDR